MWVTGSMGGGSRGDSQEGRWGNPMPLIVREQRWQKLRGIWRPRGQGRLVRGTHSTGGSCWWWNRAWDTRVGVIFAPPELVSLVSHSRDVYRTNTPWPGSLWVPGVGSCQLSVSSVWDVGGTSPFSSKPLYYLVRALPLSSLGGSPISQS